MRYTCFAQTVTWSLAAVIDRLTQHPQVAGIMQIGSTNNANFNSASDYDLVIVLADAPCPWYVGVTTIDSRFTDLLFVAHAALTQIAGLKQPLAADDTLTPIVRWLQQGRIIFDRSQVLTHAQQHVMTGDWIETTADPSVFGAWFALNYNLAQARRMLQSNDLLYQTTLHIRMAIYGHMDVWWSYFTIRKLPDTGEKNAIRYLQEHDPEFLALYQRFIVETDLLYKFGLYEQAAARVCEPVGPLWDLNTTAMNHAGTLIIWQQLLELPP